MNQYQIAQESAIERWNVGYAREWDAEIETTREVQAALEAQAAANGDEIDPTQIEADAKVIAEWLESERSYLASR